MEDRVQIYCREQDIALVEDCQNQAASQFAVATGIKCILTVDSLRYLPNNCAGGIIAHSLNGRIRCDNTLETRMEYAFELMLPALRAELFGRSDSQKFFD